MYDFYQEFYSRVDRSQAHTEFCKRVFGQNLCQHGFADMAQLNMLVAVMQLHSGQHVLDLGCGNGMISEYLSDWSEAHVTGLDYVPLAVQQAQERTRSKVDRLAFVVGDINALELPPNTFDAVISIDSLYFSSDYTRTIGELVRLLRPGGQMGIYFSYGREPWTLKEQFPMDKLRPDCTPLADALNANHLKFRTWDFTHEDYRLALLRKQVLKELRQQFECEKFLSAYENRKGDAEGISQAIEDGMHIRYLYHVELI
jgi:ubiquinone/menaquinone biosynthesis C-methylase UbiE